MALSEYTGTMYRLSVILLFLTPSFVFAQSFIDASRLISSPHLSTRVVKGASAVDVNSDGLVDVYHVARLFIQQPDGTFSNQLIESGILDGPGDVQGGIWADVDGDGYLDVFTANQTSSSFLHRNRVIGRFQGTSRGPIVRDGAVGAVWLDVDGDGQLDIFIPHATGNNRLLVRRSDRFVQLGTNMSTNRPSCGAAASDMDRNGLPDLYVATCNAVRSTDHKDALFRNDGTQFFRDLVSEGALQENNHFSQGAIWLDFNNDGYQDIFVLNHKRDVQSGHTSPVHGYDRLYKNLADGTFHDVADSVQITGLPADQGYSVAAADFDNDGWIDVLITNWPAEQFPNASNDRLYRNEQGRVFVDVFEKAISTTIPERAISALADFDNDGWIDIFFISPSGNKLFLNSGGTNHWLKVSLRGAEANYGGIGARVELYRDGLVQLREIHAGEGHASQHHNLTAHFGLGANPSIDSLIIRWPGGHVDRVTDLGPDQWISVVEGVGPKEWPGTPSPMYPENEARLPFTDRTADFSWQYGDSDGPISFHLYIRGPGLDTTFTNISGTSFSFETDYLRQGEKYHWSIAATDGYSVRRSPDVYSFWYAGSTIFPALKQSLPFTGVGMGGLDLSDYDDDGDLDLLVGGRSASGALSRLYDTVDTSGTQGEYFTFWKKLRSTSAGFLGVETGSARWGDYDSDGDGDVLITGIANEGADLITFLYENRAGHFVPASNVQLPGVAAGEASFGDYDADGDLDIVITGATRMVSPFEPVTKIYENTVGGFRDVDAQLEGVHQSSAAWGDMDGDGDLDLALMGDRSEGDFVTRVYRNDGGGHFSVALSPPGRAYGSLDWGDFDEDGDLDLLIAGSHVGPALLQGWTRIY